MSDCTFTPDPEDFSLLTSVACERSRQWLSKETLCQYLCEKTMKQR